MLILSYTNTAYTNNKNIKIIDLIGVHSISESLLLDSSLFNSINITSSAEKPGNCNRRHYLKYIVCINFH